MRRIILHYKIGTDREASLHSYIVLISVVLILLKMASNKDLYDESSRKTYNNIDSNEQLIYVEVTKNTFAGYRRELLVRSLSEVETDFYVCTECKGVMRNACLVGEEQSLVCEICVKEGVPSIFMVKSRKKILELQVKCPLTTRGCSWNGKMAKVEEHLIVCDKLVVKCYNACDVILLRNELDLHLTHSCVKRPVICEHCDEIFMYEKLTNHYLKCFEYQIPCPNKCNVNLKRKLLDSHLELECANMVVECPYKKFGCEQEVLRRELEEHKKTNQIQHLESTSIFAIREMEQLKQTNMQQTETNMQIIQTNMQLINTIKQLTETNIQLTDKDVQLTKMNKQLTERVTTLENEVENLSYPTVIRDEVVISKNIYQSTSQYSKKVNWKFLKISVEFAYFTFEQFISVSVIMENDDTTAPFLKWPFEGRFKLTLIDNNNKSYVYESDFIKLQPRNVSKDKGKYPSQLLLAKIMREDLQEDRFLTDKLKCTLQIQEIENE